MDSRPDSRVAFDPDAWQAEVLDSIDANSSLLVVGKLFFNGQEGSSSTPM